ncbi:hypothetical protein MRX96_041596 [Rhipicephalus microplus]
MARVCLQSSPALSFLRIRFRRGALCDLSSGATDGCGKEEKSDGQIAMRDGSLCPNAWMAVVARICARWRRVTPFACSVDPPILERGRTGPIRVTEQRATRSRVNKAREKRHIIPPVIQRGLPPHSLAQMSRNGAGSRRKRKSEPRRHRSECSPKMAAVYVDRKQYAYEAKSSESGFARRQRMSSTCRPPEAMHSSEESL